MADLLNNQILSHYRWSCKNPRATSSSNFISTHTPTVYHIVHHLFYRMSGRPQPIIQTSKPVHILPMSYNFTDYHLSVISSSILTLALRIFSVYCILYIIHPCYLFTITRRAICPISNTRFVISACLDPIKSFTAPTVTTNNDLLTSSIKSITVYHTAKFTMY